MHLLFECLDNTSETYKTKNHLVEIVYCVMVQLNIVTSCLNNFHNAGTAALVVIDS